MGYNWKRHFRLKRWISCIRYAVTDPRFRNDQDNKDGVKRLLIIKTEAIGDYILFRNFLKIIRESERYKGYHITLVGNGIWQSLAEKFDSPHFDRGIFLNRSRFQTDAVYRKEMLNAIGSSYYEEAVNCTFSREFMLGDLIIRSVGAKIKSGMQGDSASEIPMLNLISWHYYNNLIKAGAEEVFEFNRNKRFIEKWLQQDIHLESPEIALKAERKSYAVILPGAQDISRRWAVSGFREIANYLHAQFGFDIIIAGGPSDTETAEAMIDNNNRHFIQNVCGLNKLEDLPQLLAAASIAVCNDSGTLHIAAAVNTPCVCISNANHYGRFSPYPAAVKKPLTVLYPPSFIKKFPSESQRIKATAYGSDFSIAEISVAMVQTEIERLLHG